LVTIYISEFEKPLPQELWDLYFKRLTPPLQERNVRFIRWQDRHAHLFGKLLLLEGLKNLNVNCNGFSDVKYNSYHRPFLPYADIDFNISHSGIYVLCAIGKNLQIGIDIEENKNISLEDFKNVMTPKQWEIINNDKQPCKIFYKFWTIKESIIKADGRGLAIPLDKLEIKNNTVQYDNRLWYITELNLTDGYACAIATNKPCSLRIHKIDFYKNIIL
jgi:4'-phosphopantetheinyl transferase